MSMHLSVIEVIPNIFKWSRFTIENARNNRIVKIFISIFFDICNVRVRNVADNINIKGSPAKACGSDILKIVSLRSSLKREEQ